MTKRTQPALYELMGDEERPPAPPDVPRDEPRAMSWLGAGKSIRLPVGYIWLVTAAVIVLVVGAFSLGFLRGHRDAEAEHDRDWLASNALRVPPPEIEQEPAASPGASPGAPAPQPPAVPQLAPVESDPRVEGVNYFVLIHTDRANAVSVAKFCRDHGVEAYAVPSGKTYYRVFALPGYGKGERDAPAVKALEARIAEVARKWKLQVNPRDDLAYYPERFKG